MRCKNTFAIGDKMSDIELSTSTWADEYRPNKLSDYKGQEGVLAKINGAINRGKIPKTILICGSTGCGKTTLARILANHLNGVPEGQFNPDVVEYNLANEKGINDIRNIVAQMNYLPQKRFRIFILDEVHALQTQAASVLLKPLEDAPKHCVFILATDQPEKLLATIRGRSYPLVLDPYEPEDIVPILERVLKLEKAKITKDPEILKNTLLKVAENAGCQPRQSLQLLQGLVDIIASGEKPKNALKLAAEQMPDYGNELIAIKVLGAVYAKKPKVWLKALADLPASGSIMGLLLDLNQYLLDLQSETTNTYHSYNRKQLVGYLQKNKVEPDLKTILQVHGALVETRYRINAYTVSEKHLLIQQLGIL
jgi:DNA polymerase III subunit gamma/tau